MSKAKWALLLFVPAPSVGVVLSLHFELGLLGSLLWALAKVWLFLGPLVWWVKVEQQPISWSPARLGGFTIAMLLGFGMMAVIWGAYAWIARGSFDVTNFQHKMAIVGLDTAPRYLMVCIYWIFINSLLEEYVFRFFLFCQCEQLWGKASGQAVIAAGLFFTIHHTIALAAYVPWWQNGLASFGVFSAGVIWSWLYARYRSIWPGFVCHIFADIAVFSIGWDLLF